MTNTLNAGALGRLEDATTVDGTNDKIPVLKANGSIENATANQISSGADAVDGPASATDNALARFDAITGKLIQNSGAILDDSDNLTGVNDITASGDVTALGGDLDAGVSGTAGSVNIFPTTAASGSVAVTCADNAGDTVTAVTFAAQAGARTLTVPDPAQATANFVLDINLTDFNKFLGIEHVVVSTVGTWTPTRAAQGLAVLRHTAADDTSILMIDITEELRTTAAKGFQLDTIDVVFDIGTADLDAHTATLDRITYAESTTTVVTSMPITGTLGINQIPHVDRLTVTTPVFEVTPLTKIVLEITVNAAATSAYDYAGAVLNFTRNDL